MKLIKERFIRKSTEKSVKISSQDQYFAAAKSHCHWQWSTTTLPASSSVQKDCGDGDNHQLGVIITIYDKIEVLGCLKIGGDYDNC